MTSSSVVRTFTPAGVKVNDHLQKRSMAILMNPASYADLFDNPGILAVFDKELGEFERRMTLMDLAKRTVVWNNGGELFSRGVSISMFGAFVFNRNFTESLDDDKVFGLVGNLLRCMMQMGISPCWSTKIESILIELYDDYGLAPVRHLYGAHVWMLIHALNVEPGRRGVKNWTDATDPFLTGIAGHDLDKIFDGIFAKFIMPGKYVDVQRAFRANAVGLIKGNGADFELFTSGASIYLDDLFTIIYTYLKPPGVSKVAAMTLTLSVDGIAVFKRYLQEAVMWATMRGWYRPTQSTIDELKEYFPELSQFWTLEEFNIDDAVMFGLLMTMNILVEDGQSAYSLAWPQLVNH